MLSSVQVPVPDLLASFQSPTSGTEKQTIPNQHWAATEQETYAQGSSASQQRARPRQPQCTGDVAACFLHPGRPALPLFQRETQGWCLQDPTGSSEGELRCRSAHTRESTTIYLCILDIGWKSWENLEKPSPASQLLSQEDPLFTTEWRTKIREEGFLITTPTPSLQ